jgi:hypothetical protein
VGGEKTVCEFARTQNNKKPQINQLPLGYQKEQRRTYELGDQLLLLTNVCTGDSSFYHHHYYDHFITGFQQQINHNNTRHTNQKASVMFFLSFSVSLSLSPIEKCQSVAQPTIDFGERKKIIPGKTIKTTTRSRDPRSAFFRGTSVGVGREDDRRARRVQSGGGFQNPSSCFRRLECTSYIPTSLPTYLPTDVWNLSLLVYSRGRNELGGRMWPTGHGRDET